MRLSFVQGARQQVYFFGWRGLPSIVKVLVRYGGDWNAYVRGES